MNSEISKAAMYYRDSFGFNAIPLKNGSKIAAVKWKEFQDRKPTGEEVQSFDWTGNVGVITGKTSRLAVVDIDNPNRAHEWLEEQGLSLPDTAKAKTARGYHLYYRLPEGREVRSKDVKDGAGNVVLEVKGNGSLVVAPPSVVVKTGKDNKGVNYTDEHVYEWVRSPDEVGIAECPKWLLEELQRTSESASTVDFSRPIPQGSRNDELTRMAGMLTRLGMDSKSARESLRVVNRLQCDPPLESWEVDGISLYENDIASPSPSLKGGGSDDALPGVKMFKNIDRPTGERPFVVKGVVYKGHGAGLYGDGGTAKSTLAMDMGQRVARGDDWMSFETTRTNVLYLDFELDEIEQTRRAYDVATGQGYDAPPHGFFYMSGAGYPTKDVFERGLEACREHKIGMVILDSLGYALDGDAEASRDVLRFFKDTEASFRREGITLFVVDHQAKTQQGGRYQEKTMFGSVYKSNSLRSVLQVEPSKHEDGFLSVIIRHKKNNFGRLLEPFGAELTFGEEETKVNGRELEAGELLSNRKTTVKEKIVEALDANGPMFPAAISEAIDADHNTVKNKLTELRKDGIVEDTGNKDGQSKEVTLMKDQSEEAA